VQARIYSKPDLWRLFVAAAIPLHVWTILQALGDIQWITERTNLEDALAVGAYGLLGILLESLAVFLAVWGLGHLIGRKWPAETRIALLCWLCLLVSLWAIAGQLVLHYKVDEPGFVIRFAILSGRPLITLYLMGGLLVSATVLPPAALILFRRSARNTMLGLIDRIGTLMAIYLALDSAALLYVVSRNI